MDRERDSIAILSSIYKTQTLDKCMQAKQISIALEPGSCCTKEPVQSCVVSILNDD